MEAAAARIHGLGLNLAAAVILPSVFHVLGQEKGRKYI
jgi:hypothetical protein